MQVLHVSTGAVEALADHNGNDFRSAIRKTPRSGPVDVSTQGLDGDTTAHPSHGGTDQAVHVYPAAHYDWFAQKAGRRLPVPAFGENFTVSGLDERSVRVGDRVRVGTARFVVSQPTIRCSTIGRSHRIPEMLAWIQEDYRSGFYLAVTDPGTVQAGDAWVVEEQGPAAHTIDALNRILFTGPAAAQAELLANEVASEDWRHALKEWRGAS